jgi:type IV pilus assembly protein PilE
MAATAGGLTCMSQSRHSGLTLIEVLTVLVALVVIAAVAIPLWRTHQLRVRRADAIEALNAVQSAQDRYFGAHAEYADGSRQLAAPPNGLGIQRKSRLGFFEIEVQRSADGLGYVATARSVKRDDGPPDTRCAQMRMDQHGRQSALNDIGEDSSADCWNRL